MDCSLQGSSVHTIFQARVLEWVVISLEPLQHFTAQGEIFWKYTESFLCSGCIIRSTTAQPLYWSFNYLKKKQNYEMPRVRRYEFILTLYVFWTIPPTRFNWQDWPPQWRTIFNAFKEYLGGPLSLWLSTWISCKNTKSLCRTKKNQRMCSWRYQLCMSSSSQNNSPGCPAVERERKPEKRQ